MKEKNINPKGYVAYAAKTYRTNLMFQKELSSM